MTTTDTAPTGTASQPGPEPGIRTCVFKDGQITEHDYPLAQVSDFLADRSNLVWVDLVSPDKATLHAIAEELSLDHNSIEDAIAQDERAKATGYQDYVFVTAYSTRADGADLLAARVSAFVLDHALVTVHGDDWRKVDQLVGRWQTMQRLIAQNGSEALLYGLLDLIVDEQFETIQDLDEQIDDLDNGLFDEKPQDRSQQQKQFELRRSVVSFRRLASPMTQLLATLHRLRDTDSASTMESYWTDLEDHIARVVEWTESARDLLNNVFSANMSLQDARMNSIMKKLTAWAGIIAVPTAITGFYGQNVPYPGFSQHWGFVVSSVVILVTMGLLYLSFRKRDWL